MGLNSNYQIPNPKQFPNSNDRKYFRLPIANLRFKKIENQKSQIENEFGAWSLVFFIVQ
jgi:hypothetical protein